MRRLISGKFLRTSARWLFSEAKPQAEIAAAAIVHKPDRRSYTDLSLSTVLHFHFNLATFVIC